MAGLLARRRTSLLACPRAALRSASERASCPRAGGTPVPLELGLDAGIEEAADVVVDTASATGAGQPERRQLVERIVHAEVEVELLVHVIFGAEVIVGDGGILAVRRRVSERVRGLTALHAV